MMFEKLGSTKLHGKTLMSALLVGFLSGCEISQCLESGALCELIDAAGPPLEPINSGRSTVFEDPGTLIAYHGFACAQSDSQGQEAVVNIESSIELPAYATDATVFLNGWRLEFLNGDHEVAGFGATITDIRTENQSLKWRASGVLSDQNFDDGYKFCHFFTAVAWNQTNLRLLVDHDDGSCTGTGDLEFELVRRRARQAASRVPHQKHRRVAFVFRLVPGEPASDIKPDRRGVAPWLCLQMAGLWRLRPAPNRLQSQP